VLVYNPITALVKKNSKSLSTSPKKLAVSGEVVMPNCAAAIKAPIVSYLCKDTLVPEGSYD